MKKFCLCLFALSPFVGNFGDYNTVEVMASKPVASYTCEVTCPSEGGFPEVPKLYPCNQLPAMSANCTVFVNVTMVLEKEDLQKVIKILQTLTGTKEIE